VFQSLSNIQSVICWDRLNFWLDLLAETFYQILGHREREREGFLVVSKQGRRVGGKLLHRTRVSRQRPLLDPVIDRIFCCPAGLSWNLTDDYIDSIMLVHGWGWAAPSFLTKGGNPKPLKKGTVVTSSSRSHSASKSYRLLQLFLLFWITFAHSHHTSIPACYFTEKWATT